MKLKVLLAASVAALSLAAAGGANAALTFVGSWHVGDGPVWTDNPAVLTAQETAALLFGGVASDYSISTLGNDPNLVNFRAHVDGWGDGQYLTGDVAQNYSLDTGNPGYNDPYGGPSYSAYVLDHSCFDRYSDPSQSCAAGEPGQNFAFRNAVPEPATWALMIGGFGMAGSMLRRRRLVTAA